ncbi:MAG: carbonic anhydrase family protein [Gemmatimonadota bacterium]|nr:carbonic anhydrase family protein [Gemmatimonadota bacterium]
MNLFRLTTPLCIMCFGRPARSEPEGSSSVSDKPAWGYGAENGPAAWGRLSADYALCADGLRQSPVDLRNPTPASLPAITFNYRPTPLNVHNNGHTIEVASNGENWLGVGGERYDLAQYHFHAPSEHTVAGRSFDMEMHLVHRNEKGALAVIGVLIRRGRRHVAFDPVWEHLPQSAGEMKRIEGVSVNPADLLPPDTRAYRYDGSLTTPPCSQDVSWFVIATPMEMSEAQIAAFEAIFHNNNRPVQALNGREVFIDIGMEE